MPGKYFLDSNIIVYAHDIDKKYRQIAEQDIIDGVLSGNAVISAQVISEFFVTVTQKIKEPLSISAAEAEVALLSRLEVVALDIFLVQTAIQLQRKHKLSYWDSLILASAIKAGCAEIHSENFTDGRRYEGVLVKNIFL
jgi:predicted nucleic acid-binding protein